MLAGPALGTERLHLPEPLRAAIAAVCPDCATRGVIACGDADVRPGKAYLERARLGTPPRAYLMRWPLGDRDIRQLSETLPQAAAEAAIAKAFADAPLIALDAGGGARALPPPAASVAIPPGLHACLADPAKPWGCCAGDCRTGECCEKSLGSHRISLRWLDPDTNETLRFRWSRSGSTMLTRKTADGGETQYFCLVWGPLRLD
ncbi:hypothetical protein DKG75_01625 [Zavarzinia compransoris]|uniref:Uncharacterized protein n=1 Tax=Zavarzinia compransoris TaxID=1264899 RepID=A0A317EDK2_9PROT|nr:hypothetical protein DKG75_01625 [Zavarzinia compransoris]